jgi:hypothetical protein
MSKQFINEVSRMKNLFDYKRGMVISEQIILNEEGGSPIAPGTLKTAVKAAIDLSNLSPEDQNYVSDTSWKSQKPDEDHGMRQCYATGFSNPPCDVIWDGYIHNYMPEDVWVKKFGTQVPDTVGGKDNKAKANTTTSTTTNTNDNYQLDTPQKIGEFQTWMDKNYGKWAYSKKYNRNYNVGGNPKFGFGVLGPNTKNAWDNKNYKEEYLKTLSANK